MEIITCDPSVYIIEHPKFIASNQQEKNNISFQLLHFVTWMYVYVYLIKLKLNMFKPNQQIEYIRTQMVSCKRIGLIGFWTELSHGVSAETPDNSQCYLQYFCVACLYKNHNMDKGVSLENNFLIPQTIICCGYSKELPHTCILHTLLDTIETAGGVH